MSAVRSVIFVLGGPGSGKGTQCAKIAEHFGFIHLSAGDLLRAERNRPGSEKGEMINTYIKEGKIVPSEVTIGLLDDAMIESKANKFLIDGFPRNAENRGNYEKLMGTDNIKLVLFFDCPEDCMISRLLKRGETSGRVDDNMDSIKKRFQTYNDDTMPVVEHYEKEGKVRRFDATAAVDDVFAKVSDSLIAAGFSRV